MALVFLALLLLCAPAVGHAQNFTLYDSFDASPAIDAALWSGFEQNTNPDAIANLEAVRKIVPDPLFPGNRLLQEQLTTAHTGTGSDTGQAGQGRLSLSINKAELRDSSPAITGISVKGVITAAKAQDCPTNARATTAGVLVFGFFFNDGNGDAGTGDRTGDVFAGIEAVLDSNAGRHIVAVVKRCDDSTCSSTSDVTAPVTFDTTWQVGKGGWATVAWDHANHQFVFFLRNPNNLPHGESHTLAYALSDTTPPVAFFHEVRVVNDLPNCSTPIKASITVLVDKVLITTENVFP